MSRGPGTPSEWIPRRTCTKADVTRCGVLANTTSELDVLATVMEAYEDKHLPMDLPDPIEAIKFRMEQ